MIKIPNALEARVSWNITDQQVRQMNKYFDNIHKNFDTKINNFIQIIKAKDAVYGLHDYFNFSSRDEAYVIHMSLVRNDNIMISVENGKVKYSYANAQVKYAMGFSAYGLQYIDDNCRRVIRKKIRTPSDITFINILFIMNSLIGLALHNRRIFDIMHLTKSLAINLDEVLIALSILKNNSFIFVSHNNPDEPDSYEFTFNNYFENYIKSKQEQTNSKKNIKIENNIVFTSDINKIYQQVVEYFKSKSTFDEFKTIPKINNLSQDMSMALRNLLAKDLNIAFRPNNFESERKIVYAYHYIDANKKSDAAANTVMYRFIDPKLSQQLINISHKYHFKMKANIFDSLWILDYLYRNNNDSIKINKTILKNLGFIDVLKAKDNVYDLAVLGCIEIIHEYISDARLNFEVNINDSYRRIKDADALNRLIVNNLTKEKVIIEPAQEPLEQVYKEEISETISEINESTVFNNDLQIYLDQYLKQINDLNMMNAKLLIQLAKSRHELSQLRQNTRMSTVMMVDEQIQKISQTLSMNLNNIANLLYGSDNLNKFGAYRKKIFEDFNNEKVKLLTTLTEMI